MLKLLTLYYLLRQWLYPAPKERAALAAWQNRRLEKHVKRLAKKAPFYAERLQKYGHWSKFPSINKSIFMQEFDRINTVGIRKEEAMRLALQAEESRDFSPEINGITVGLSSGTSGNRGVFLVSLRERAAWVAYVLRGLLGLKMKKRKVAFFLRANSNLYASSNSSLLEFRFFDLTRPVAENLDALKQFMPDIIVAQPSMLLMIAQAQEHLKLNPQKIISVAEVLEEKDKSYLQATFGQNIHQAYQCTEGFLAKTCMHGTLHFNEDLVKIEKHYIDEEQKRYHPIISDFTRSSQPLIRYELNDIIVERDSPCPCGSHFMAIGHIEGRSDDMFYLPDGKGATIAVFPDFIRRALISADESVLEYVVEQVGLAELNVYLAVADFESSKKRVEESLKGLLSQLGVAAINCTFYNELPTLGANKLRRVRRKIG